MDSFGQRDDAAPKPVMDRLNLGQESGFVEDSLGQIDQMRTVALNRPCGGRCGGQEPGMATHHYGDVNARQRAMSRSAPMNAWTTNLAAEGKLACGRFPSDRCRWSWECGWSAGRTPRWPPPR